MKPMMKNIALMLMVCLGAFAANAQTMTKLFGIRNAPVEKFEGEIFGGLALQLGESESGSKKAGWGVGAEVRYNFLNKPVDIGLRYAYASTEASFTTYRVNSVMAVGDWNFLRGSTFNPFAGAGIGMALPSDMHRNARFAFMPRVGFEYNDWLRLTASAQFSDRYCHNFQVSLGFVIGGRKKFDPDKYIADMKPTAHGGQPSVIRQPFSEDARRLYDMKKEEQKYRGRTITYGILGGVSLGIGAFLTTSGIVALADNHNGNDLTTLYGVLFTCVGGVFTLGSVPLFIASHHQSVKAATISASIEPLITPNQSPAPGIGLSVSF